MNEQNAPDERIAICLSGGGYRAALFHLGTLRRLNELGLLTGADTISSVSGGSIISAHLAACFAKNPPSSGPNSDWEEKVAKPFREFCKRDIRTVPVLKRFLLPWNWPRRSTQVKSLMGSYEKYLTRLKLSELPVRPTFVFCAADIVFGKNWEFRRDKVGDYKTRQIKTPESWTVGRAVAASSCFPPVFDPMRVGKVFLDGIIETSEDMTERQKLLSVLRLSDGGVYDNLGMEPAKGHYSVFVSDGGSPFRVFTASSPLRLWMRYFDIALDQVGALRKRWLFDNFETLVEKNGEMIPKRQGGFFPIGKGSTDKNDPSLPGYSDDLVESVISRIRTDLDGFTDEEIGVLENHGYMMANRITKQYCRHLVEGDWPPAVPPHPKMFDESWVRKMLEDSHKRVCLSRMLRRLFSQAISQRR